jgi:hypothetical protein
MCGVLASAGNEALDTSRQAIGSNPEVHRGRGPALQELSHRGVGKTIAVVSTVLLVCTGSYLTLRNRTRVQSPAAVHSVGTPSSPPNTPSAVARSNETEASLHEDGKLRSAEPRPGANPSRGKEDEDDDPIELWSRVRQGDTEAEVTLAKLYLRGTALERNCEQAHMLLLAAAQKQNKVADRILGGVYQQQCP